MGKGSSTVTRVEVKYLRRHVFPKGWMELTEGVDVAGDLGCESVLCSEEVLHKAVQPTLNLRGQSGISTAAALLCASL